MLHNVKTTRADKTCKAAKTTDKDKRARGQAGQQQNKNEIEDVATHLTFRIWRLMLVLICVLELMLSSAEKLEKARRMLKRRTHTHEVKA